MKMLQMQMKNQMSQNQNKNGPNDDNDLGQYENYPNGEYIGQLII